MVDGFICPPADNSPPIVAALLVFIACKYIIPNLDELVSIL